MADDFTDEQKQYLHGFAAGAGLAQKLGALPTFAGTLGLATDGPKPAEQICYDAQDRQTAAGRKLCNEELAKRKRFPLDQWDDIVAHARDNKPPAGTDVLAFKYHGLFWVAPAQQSFMARLRFPGGVLKSHQLRGVADLAESLGGGYADVTTRANLQVREIPPKHTADFCERLIELGILNRGAGADNIRNITATPTAGIDPQELIDTLPLARQLNTYILNHREMYGLPRKFNISFDGGGTIAALEDTNDIGFTAVRLQSPVDGADVAFRLTLGGITGHKDFARDTGLIVLPAECVEVAAAIVRAFIKHGDRTDRKKARLKYVLDRMGFDGFLKEVESELGRALRAVSIEHCEPRPQPVRDAHVGWHRQKQEGKSYAGVVLPVGRITSSQMREVASIADQFGSGTIRLTVWQNLLISDIPDSKTGDVEARLESVGLTTRASSVRAGVVACTGNAGCKYANTNTKLHGMQIVKHIESTLELDTPINIHLTGCPHSCAQHYIGDIGLLGTKMPVNDADDAEMIEAYHIFVGGGHGENRAIGREIFRNVPASAICRRIESMLAGYLSNRSGNESFNEFVRRHEIAQLQAIFDAHHGGMR